MKFLTKTLLNTAQAASPVKGSVPVVQPLQPAPVGVEPNISHNVNSVTNAGVLPEGTAVPQVDQSGDATLVSSNGAGVSSSVNSGKTGFSYTLLIIVGILIIAGALFVWYRQRRDDAIRVKPNRDSL